MIYLTILMSWRIIMYIEWRFPSICAHPVLVYPIEVTFIEKMAVYSDIGYISAWPRPWPLCLTTCRCIRDIEEHPLILSPNWPPGGENVRNLNHMNWLIADRKNWNPETVSSIFTFYHFPFSSLLQAGHAGQCVSICEQPFTL